MASPFKHSTLSNFYSGIQFEDLNWTCILFWLVHFLLFLLWVLSFVVFYFQLRCFRLFVLGFPLLRRLLCCYTERPRAGGRTRAYSHARAFQTLAPPYEYDTHTRRPISHFVILVFLLRMLFVRFQSVSITIHPSADHVPINHSFTGKKLLPIVVTEKSLSTWTRDGQMLYWITKS